MDGEDRTVAKEVTRSIVDPGTGDEIATVSVASAEMGEEAVSIADDSLDEWTGLDPSERGRALTETAQLFEAQGSGRRSRVAREREASERSGVRRRRGY